MRQRARGSRRRAIERSRSARPRAPRGWRWALVPAGTVAATALVAWLDVWQTPPASDAVQAAALGDLEILLGEEDLEMLDEELEFYGWLEEQPEFAGADDSVG